MKNSKKENEVTASSLDPEGQTSNVEFADEGLSLKLAEVFDRFKDNLFLDEFKSFKLVFDGVEEFRIFDGEIQKWRSEGFFLDESLNVWEEFTKRRLDKSSVREKIKANNLKILNNMLSKLTQLKKNEEQMIVSKFLKTVKRQDEEIVEETGQTRELILEHLQGHLPTFNNENAVLQFVRWMIGQGWISSPEDIRNSGVDLTPAFENMGEEQNE